MKHCSTSMQATSMTYPKGKSNRIFLKKTSNTKGNKTGNYDCFLDHVLIQVQQITVKLHF